MQKRVERSKKHRDGEKTLRKERKTSIEYHYFISSLPYGIDTLARAVRGHWSVESMHWYLVVTFREDADTTLDKIAAQNHNIIRKLKNKNLNLSIHTFVLFLTICID